MKQPEIFGMAELQAYEKKVRADQKAQDAKEVSACIEDLLAIVKRLYAVVGVEIDVVLPKDMRSPAPKPAKRRSIDAKVSEQQIEEVYTVLFNLTDKTTYTVAPKGLVPVLKTIGLKTIAACCRRLVQQQRAECKGGRYRVIVEPSAIAPDSLKTLAQEQ